MIHKDNISHNDGIFQSDSTLIKNEHTHSEEIINNEIDNLSQNTPKEKLFIDQVNLTSKPNINQACNTSPKIDNYKSLEGGGDNLAGRDTACIDTQFLIDDYKSDPYSDLGYKKNESLETCLNLPLATCYPLPPKINKNLDQNLQLKKALNIERAKLLSNSPDKKQRQLSQKLFQCTRNIRISKTGKPLFWQCKSKHCHVCHYFKQQKLLKTFKRNLTKNRYVPHSWKLITLTLPTTCNPSEIKEGIKKLNTNFAKLMRRKAWQDSIEGGVKAVEIARADDPKKYRPHLHILCAVNDSFSSNKLFQFTRSTLDQLNLGVDVKEENLRHNLSFTWGKYFKRQYTVTHIKSIDKNQKTHDDLPWLSANKIDPHELTYTALEYITKGEEADCTFSETQTPYLTTSHLIYQLKGIRAFSTFGTLQGYLTPPKKPKLTEEQRQAISDQLKSANIKTCYQYNAFTKEYEKIEQFTPHYESWSIFRDKINRVNDPCSPSEHLPKDLSHQDQENPIRCKHLTMSKD